MNVFSLVTDTNDEVKQQLDMYMQEPLPANSHLFTPTLKPGSKYTGGTFIFGDGAFDEKSQAPLFCYLNYKYELHQ